jgi:hypothetical protein
MVSIEFDRLVTIRNYSSHGIHNDCLMQAIANGYNVVTTSQLLCYLLPKFLLQVF